MNYEELYATFEWDPPAHFNFATDIIDKWAESNPNQLAMIWVDGSDNTGHWNEEKRTYADISRRSKQLCNALLAQGVQRGDVVILMLGRELEWWEIMTAGLRMGMVLSPGTTQMTEKDIAYRIKASDATCFITTEAHAAKLEAVESQCPTLKSKIITDGTRAGWASYHDIVGQASDSFDQPVTDSTADALCYFTSGTTGNPKMVLHTHANYALGHDITGRYWLDQKPSDLHWNISDTGWAKAAWSSYFGPWNCGSTLFIYNALGFDPAKTLEILQQYPITTLCGPPTVYRMLVLQNLSQYQFPTLRHCTSAGEPLNPEVIETWQKATNCIIRDGYGQTETVLICGNFPSVETRYGSMGKPAPGMDLQVIDEQGNILPPGTEGDIALNVVPTRPAGLFKEYWKDAERTSSSFVGDWYITGDRAYMDEDGYFWFVGRADDVIISAGYRIGPFEVESALLEHPAVAESAVVASPDDVRGAVVKAFIVLMAGVAGDDSLIQEIQDHVKNVTAPYKYPRKIEFVESLPKTISGKIRRVELRAREIG